jgi:hypothetical protein
VGAAVRAALVALLLVLRVTLAVASALPRLLAAAKPASGAGAPHLKHTWRPAKLRAAHAAQSQSPARAWTVRGGKTS